MIYKRPHTKSLTERLNYSGIRNGIVFNRTRGVETGVELSLPTASQITDAARESLAEALRTIMLQGIRQRMRGRFIAECAPISDATMMHAEMSDNVENDLLKLLMDTQNQQLNEARKRGELSQWRFYFTIRLDTKQTRKARNVAYLESEINTLMQRAEAVRSNLTNLLNAAGFQATPLSTQQAFELCWRFYNPALASANAPGYRANPSFKPTARVGIERSTDVQTGIMDFFRSLITKLQMRGNNNPLEYDQTAFTTSARDQIAETELDVDENNYLRSSDRYIQTINLIANGDGTMAGMSDGLMQSLSGHHVYYILDMHHLYQPDVRKKLIGSAKDINVTASDTSLGSPDITNFSKLDQISQTLHRYNSNQESVFEYGLSVVVMAKNIEELEYLRETARSQIAMMGGNKVIVGNVQNLVQYVDALGPLNARDNEFMFQNMSENVSHFFPLTGPFTGSRQPVAVYRNRMGGLTGINPKDGTINYGTLIIGSAGSGKTFFSQDYMMNIAAKGAEIIAVDMKSDYTASIRALGGQIIPFYPGEQVRVQRHGVTEYLPIRYNAFELDPGEVEPSEEHKLFLLAFLTVLLDQNELRGGQRAIITAAIDDVYNRHLDTDLQDNKTLKTVTLSDFVHTLENLNSVNNISLRDYEEGQTIVQELALSLQTYLGRQVMGTFLDGPSTIDLNNPYLYFDLNKMADQPELMKIALLLIMRVMWKKAKHDKSTIKLEIIEEIGVLFKIPAALNFVEKIFKLGRAYNMWPVAITQEINDFRLGRGLINNTSQIIIGKVSPEEAATVADVLSLNEAALGLINSLGGEKGVYREYLALSVKESGTTGDVIQFWPSKVHYWSFTSTPEEASMRDKLTREFGGNDTEAIRRLAGMI